MNRFVQITILFMEGSTRIEECGEGDLSLSLRSITVLHRITQPAQLVADCMEERTDGECTFYPPPTPAALQRRFFLQPSLCAEAAQRSPGNYSPHLRGTHQRLRWRRRFSRPLRFGWIPKSQHFRICHLCLSKSTTVLRIRAPRCKTSSYV